MRWFGYEGYGTCRCRKRAFLTTQFASSPARSCQISGSLQAQYIVGDGRRLTDGSHQSISYGVLALLLVISNHFTH
jgi:hypothetical protein